MARIVLRRVDITCVKHVLRVHGKNEIYFGRGICAGLNLPRVGPTYLDATFALWVGFVNFPDNIRLAHPSLVRSEERDKRAFRNGVPPASLFRGQDESTSSARVFLGKSVRSRLRRVPDNTRAN